MKYTTKNGETTINLDSIQSIESSWGFGEQTAKIKDISGNVYCLRGDDVETFFRAYNDFESNRMSKIIKSPNKAQESRSAAKSNFLNKIRCQIKEAVNNSQTEALVEIYNIDPEFVDFVFGSLTKDGYSVKYAVSGLGWRHIIIRW